MILNKAYKAKLKKIEKQLFDLGGEELVKLQDKYIIIIQNILDTSYREAVRDFSTNTDLLINELSIDQEQFIEKDFSTNFNKFVTMVKKAFNIGQKQINNLLTDTSLATNFGLKVDEVEDYLAVYAGSRITGLDDVTKNRVSKLLNLGIEKGWGVSTLAKKLKEDYAFSSYRSRLIASNEIGNAYIQGKDRQFKKISNELGGGGYKNWASHRDDRTTHECYENDVQGWIGVDEEFQSGDSLPPRFPGCRCNIVYSFSNPDEET